MKAFLPVLCLGNKSFLFKPVNEGDTIKTLTETIPKIINWISIFRDSEVKICVPFLVAVFCMLGNGVSIHFCFSVSINFIFFAYVSII